MYATAANIKRNPHSTARIIGLFIPCHQLKASKDSISNASKLERIDHRPYPERSRWKELWEIVLQTCWFVNMEHVKWCLSSFLELLWLGVSTSLLLPFLKIPTPQLVHHCRQNRAKTKGTCICPCSMLSCWDPQCYSIVGLHLLDVNLTTIWFFLKPKQTATYVSPPTCSKFLWQHTHGWVVRVKDKWFHVSIAQKADHMVKK